ncbi:recombinase family protein [Paraburkholderia sp. ZP32-5]|uniref:recombinase family protein n=1 Tax=Paraburkholderia sp. ZP32-5 TaxID=2883245 RepID=UPI001F40254E|nr:recombinase family protein [Paraburkholderia sp. ZP32-5]
MRIGYARVSTDDQHLDLQIAALERASCDRIFTDHGVSGAKFKRPGLDRALRTLKKGDTLIVWRLDRLGRSLLKLIELTARFAKKGIHFVSLMDTIDTTTPMGSFYFHLVAAFSQLEREMIGERTRAGIAAARAKGRPHGRRRALTDEQCREAQRLLRELPRKVVAQRYEIHPQTLTRSLIRVGIVPVYMRGSPVATSH